MKPHSLKNFLREWRRSNEGTAAVEFVLVFPILMIMLMGVDEIGTGIMVDQKTIAATQIVADLIARYSNVTDDDLANVVKAGQLALDPYDTSPLGFDIVSIQFDKNNNPQELWRDTVNMAPNNDGINRSVGLGVSGDGVLAVTATYKYTPPMGSYIISSINMEEVSFARGRTSSVITKQ
jgi:Flp pilus assembly protein TadG